MWCAARKLCRLLDHGVGDSKWWPCHVTIRRTYPARKERQLAKKKTFNGRVVDSKQRENVRPRSATL